MFCPLQYGGVTVFFPLPPAYAIGSDLFSLAGPAVRGKRPGYLRRMFVMAYPHYVDRVRIVLAELSAAIRCLHQVGNIIINIIMCSISIITCVCPRCLGAIFHFVLLKLGSGLLITDDLQRVRGVLGTYLAPTADVGTVRVCRNGAAVCPVVGERAR